MSPYLALITPLSGDGGSQPGVPTHPIQPVPPGPSHPIYPVPPSPGVPSHPIVGFPSFPIVIPPGSPGAPSHPIYLPGTPSHPIAGFPDQGLPPGQAGAPSHPDVGTPPGNLVWVFVPGVGWMLGLVPGMPPTSDAKPDQELPDGA
jgi:hypothetical protein